MATDKAQSINRALGNAHDEAYDIRITRDGSWYHNGGRINRPALVKLFSTVLQRDEAGDYWLKTPAEQGRITVEDVPFVALEVVAANPGDTQAQQELRFRTNVDDWVTADQDHPIRVHIGDGAAEPVPYIHIRNGLDARIVRAVYYHLMDLAEERPGPDGTTEVGVWSKGIFFPLGRYSPEQI